LRRSRLLSSRKKRVELPALVVPARLNRFRPDRVDLAARFAGHAGGMTARFSPTRPAQHDILWCPGGERACTANNSNFIRRSLGCVRNWTRRNDPPQILSFGPVVRRICFDSFALTSFTAPSGHGPSHIPVVQTLTHSKRCFRDMNNRSCHAIAVHAGLHQVRPPQAVRLCSNLIGERGSTKGSTRVSPVGCPSRFRRSKRRPSSTAYRRAYYHPWHPTPLPSCKLQGLRFGQSDRGAPSVGWTNRNGSS